MTDPSTPAGRALHKAEMFDLTVAEDRRRLALAIEAEARAEGRREAVREIRKALPPAFYAPSHPLNPATDDVGLLTDYGVREILADVERGAGLNASEPEASCEQHGHRHYHPTGSPFYHDECDITDRSRAEEHTQDCINAFYGDGGQSGCICGADRCLWTIRCEGETDHSGPHHSKDRFAAPRAETEARAEEHRR